MAHTPGPWTQQGLVVVALGADKVVHLPSLTDHTADEARADAHLIAAAPDLLAACQEFVRKCDSGEARSRRSYAEMKAAIAKAEGR